MSFFFKRFFGSGSGHVATPTASSTTGPPTETKQLPSDFNQKSPDGNTPLHVAALNGHSEVAKLRLVNGADVNAMARKKGRKPFDVLHKSSALKAVLHLRGLGHDVLVAEVAKCAAYCREALA